VEVEKVDEMLRNRLLRRRSLEVVLRCEIKVKVKGGGMLI